MVRPTSHPSFSTWPSLARYRTLHLFQRVCTSREELGGGWGFFTQIEPKWPLPYSTGTVPVPLLRDARPADWVTYCSICARTMLRAQNRAGKGSILMQRRLALAILLLFIYDLFDNLFQWTVKWFFLNFYREYFCIFWTWETGCRAVFQFAQAMLLLFS